VKKRIRAVWRLSFAAFIGSMSCRADAIEWESGEGYLKAKLPPLASTKTGFTLLPGSMTGVVFTNFLSEERIMANANLLNGSGVGLGDYDGDGLCDIYLCDLNGTSALFRNLGNWKFTNVTDSAGVACPGQTSTGAVFADLNGDGRPDLLVTSMGGPNACFLNEGGGHFTNVTAAAGLTSRLGSASMALADIDGNGTLDLYVANYGVTSLLRSGGALSYGMVDGKPVVTGRYAKRIKIIDGMMYELGEPDALYLNDGHARFRPLSWTDGTFLDEHGKPLAEAPWDQGLTVLFRDFNGDGYPDLYVCNDASTPDHFWLNDGKGRFRALHPLAQRHTSYFSMCADSADLDRDGQDEFLVVDMLGGDHRRVMTQMSEMHPQPRRIGEIANQPQTRRNTLFHACGDGSYAEIAYFSGIAGSEWTWGCTFLDVDLDGWEDILIPNGFAYDMDDLDARDHFRSMGPLSLSQSRKKILAYPRLDTANLAFRNQHDLTFREVGADWGFDSKQVSNGMALADLDNDGDLDVVINCLNAPPLLYRNETAAPRIGVRLKGKTPNTQGIGAKIKITGGPVTQTQEVISGGRYVSGDDPMRVFATGSSTNLAIEVAWRSGQKSLISGLQANLIYEIDETSARDVPPPKSPLVEPVFQDVSELLPHTHHEEPYDDAERQPLLPRLLSQPGPGVAWFDWDGDGYDDLVVGAGRGGTLGVFHNDGKGAFSRLSEPALNSPVPDDLGGIVGLMTGSRQQSILAALGNYEALSNSAPSVLRYDAAAGRVARGADLPPFASSSGPLALGDVDRDGQLDLFVGGRVLPGRYPEAASSRIYRNRAGQFQMDEERSKLLEDVGLVNGAVFSDVNGDGHVDLVLACDWGPIRVFINEGGRFMEATDKLGLAKYLGWWNGVTTGDFDGDGRMDIVASNWGRNTRYEQHRVKPLRMYYGDLDGNGSIDLVEAYSDTVMGKVVPEQPLGTMSQGLPALRGRVKTHKAYAEAGVAELFGEPLKAAKLLEANWLETTVFLNRGDHFEPRPLPREAQFAPCFGISVGDFDGDGNEDVFLAQNFFATLHNTSRYDAGRGLWLKGDGAGNFAPVSGQHSGVKVYGEQRGCALADYDHDGRVDLVVSQNGAATKLYHNVGAKPGCRVRLQGTDANPAGIGAAIRLFFGDKAGPIREVHAGSGYWSQDSSVQVMGAPETPTRIWVRWPGGKTITKDLPPNNREIEVSNNE
jgi:enediyne biosynthesis protein E4